MRGGGHHARPVALQSYPGRIAFHIGDETVGVYRPQAHIPGFSTLAVAEGRNLLATDTVTGTGIWLTHGCVNGLPFGAASHGSPYDQNLLAGLSQVTLESATPAPGNTAPSPFVGQIVSTEFLARRGSQSVGFRQECAWIGPEGEPWLRDVRTLRVHPGPCAGSRLDLTLRLQAPDTGPVTLGLTGAPFLAVRVARPLFAAGGGQFRNSQGDYERERIHDRSAAWCGCTGVIEGETVGFVLLDHPQNPFSPAPWIAQEEGLFSPSPFLRHEITLTPSTSITFRYRFQTHRGYVDQGWATERLAEFIHEPLG